MLDMLCAPFSRDYVVVASTSATNSATIGHVHGHWRTWLGVDMFECRA